MGRGYTEVYKTKGDPSQTFLPFLPLPLTRSLRILEQGHIPLLDPCQISLLQTHNPYHSVLIGLVDLYDLAKEYGDLE